MREAADDLLAATESRRVELGKKWKQVFQEAGVTHQTLNRWRHGHPVAPLTERALERALQWGPGAREAIADKRDPEHLDETLPRDTAATSRASSPGVERALTLSPAEALRRVVRSSAQDLGVTAEALGEVFEAVLRDLEVIPPSGRTDLSDLVREGRRAAGLSLAQVAARAVDPESGDNVIDADWLDRLERAALTPAERPEYPQLGALVDALHLDAGRVEEAAGVQFMGVHYTWSEDGQARGIGFGELQGEDRDKAQHLIAMYRKAPRRDG